MFLPGKSKQVSNLKPISLKQCDIFLLDDILQWQNSMYLGISTTRAIKKLQIKVIIKSIDTNHKYFNVLYQDFKKLFCLLWNKTLL